ncbi:hypothetical protein Dsin_021966 [Dipteronia sinensis]|uniref:Pectinesterase inhibitor domain-containing protein n=1 Tax=Dipteronia sinensis TaxID=43782 RepID=A0AAE0DZH6_9ROSI|nr:hypothetical protein Dsin_021966 [Dipteronia sinensis]
MKNPTCFYIRLLMLYIVVYILFVEQNTATTTSNNDEVSLIRQSCNVTDYPDTCLSILEADHRSRSATDLKSLTRISMDILCEHSIGLKSLFIKAKENVTGPRDESSVRVCIQGFDYCNFDVKKNGIPHFEKGNYFELNRDIGVCAVCANDCIDTGINLFNKEIVTLRDLSIDILSFIDMLPS